MAGRPQIWQRFARILWAREYEYTDDGRMRDRSRNVLREHGTEREVILRVCNFPLKVRLPKRDILALEYFGYPQWTECIVCSKRFNDRVVHLSGDYEDCSRDNLKYTASRALRRHEFKCLEWAMKDNEVPPYKWTVSKRVLRQRRERLVGDDWDWGSTSEVIPILGDNEGARERRQKRAPEAQADELIVDSSPTFEILI